MPDPVQIGLLPTQTFGDIGNRVAPLFPQNNAGRRQIRQIKSTALGGLSLTSDNLREAQKIEEDCQNDPNVTGEDIAALIMRARYDQAVYGGFYAGVILGASQGP